MYKAKVICISGFLVLGAFLQLPEFNLYDSKRILQMGLLIIIGLLAGISLLQKNKSSFFVPAGDPVPSKPVIAAFAVFIIAGLISTLLSDRIEFAALEYLYFFLLLAAMFMIIPQSLRNHYLIGQVIFATALFYTGLYLIIFFGNYISSFMDPMIVMWPEKYSFSIIFEGSELKGREVLYFVNKRFFNHTQTWTLPILIGLLLMLYKKRPQDFILHSLLFLAVSFWWMLIFASGGRGSTVALISSLLIIAILFRKEAIAMIKIAGATFISGGVFYYLFFRLFSTDGIPMMRSAKNVNLRLQSWEVATELWMQNPFFGMGPMHFASMQNMIDSIPWSAHPHNFYLQILTEWGIIAFLALAVLLFMAGKMVIRNFSGIVRNSSNRIIYISITWSMAAALIHAFVSGVMVTAMSQVWFILIGAWLLGFSMRGSSSNENFRRINYMSYVYLLLLGAVLFLTFEDILTLKSLYSEYMATYPDDQFFPRFWGQGLFE
jgi:putative inorganic carbon (hco3(-)) transporter